MPAIPAASYQPVAVVHDLVHPARPGALQICIAGMGIKFAAGRGETDSLDGHWHAQEPQGVERQLLGPARSPHTPKGSGLLGIPFAEKRPAGALPCRCFTTIPNIGGSGPEMPEPSQSRSQMKLAGRPCWKLQKNTKTWQLVPFSVSSPEPKKLDNSILIRQRRNVRNRETRSRNVASLLRLGPESGSSPPKSVCTGSRGHDA